MFKHTLLFAAVAGLVLALVWPAQAATITFTGANKTNGDNWNVITNWNSTAGPIPSGTDDVDIPASKQVTAASAATPIYTGNLSIGTNAYLQIGYTDGNQQDYNALGTPGTTIISMSAGSTLAVSRVSGIHIIPAIQLLGDVTIKTGQSTNASPTLKFDYGITGAYKVTFMGKGDSKINLNVANTFSSFVADPLDGSGFLINANIAGSLGNGNVTIKPYPTSNVISANLVIVAANAMADTATLTLNGPASATKLKMLASDTIGRLVVDGVQQLAGTYGKIGSIAQYQVSWMDAASTSILSVAAAPSAYWDIDGANPGAGGANPAGTWDASTTSNWNAAADGTGAAALWSASTGQTAVFAAGTDAIGSYDVTVDGTQDIGGLTFEEGTVTLKPAGTGGTLRMTADSLVRVASGSAATISTPISNDATARQMSKGGAGTLVLSGANTYTGVTRVEGGTLSVASLANAGSDSPIGNYPTAGAAGLVLAGGGTFQYTGGTTSINRGLTLAGNSTIDVPAGVTLTLGACATYDGTYTLNVTGGSGSSLALGAVTLANATGMTLNPTTASLTVASISANWPYGYSAATLTLDGTSTGNAIPGAIAITTAGSSLNVVKSNTGTWTLSGTSTYTGTTTVNAGTLIAGTNALNNANGAFGKQNNVDLNLGVANGNNAAGILIGGPYTVGRIIRNATNNTTDNGTRVLTLGGSTAANSTFSGNIFLGTTNQTSKGVTLTAASGGQVTFSGVIQNPTGQDASEAAAAAALVAVTKAGLGTVLLTNANAYTGATTVSNGTLEISGTGSINQSSGVSINGANAKFMQNSSVANSRNFTVTQGILGGGGTITGTVNVLTGGILAPGASIGTLKVGATTIDGTFLVDVDNLGGSDLLEVTGNLTLGSGSILSIVDPGQLTPGLDYAIATYTGNLGGTFGTTPNLPGGWYVDYGYKTAKTITLVPEPATLVLLALGGLGLILSRKRK